MSERGITILNKSSNSTDFAVLELSTKAVKLLIGPQKALVKEDPNIFKNFKGDFNFNRFIRKAEKPEAGKGLDSNMVMDMNYFNRNVIPSIKVMLREISSSGINKVVCVATAAYRLAKNQDEILKSVMDNCGLNVKVLTKKEEAEATYFAFLHSKPDWIAADESQILIDQGGGSMEVTFFKNSTMVQSHSLDFGTTDLLKELFNNIPTNKETIKEGFDRCREFIHAHLRDMYLEAHKAGLFFDTKFDLCVGVGTAITKATGKKNNASQHSFEMSTDFLKSTISIADIELSDLKLSPTSDRISTTAELKVYFDRLKDRYEPDAQVQNNLTMRLGLPIILELLDKFELNQLMVSGTGLWYGIYFQEIYSS